MKIACLKSIYLKQVHQVLRRLDQPRNYSTVILLLKVNNDAEFVPKNIWSLYRIPDQLHQGLLSL